MNNRHSQCFIHTATFTLTGTPQQVLAENWSRISAFISASGALDIVIGTSSSDLTHDGYNISATVPQEIQGLEAVYAASNTGGPTAISVMEESY